MAANDVRNTVGLSAVTQQSVGYRIGALRKARGFTLAQVASACDISDATVSRIENGQSPISAHHLFALAKFLGADMTEFFQDESAPLRAGMRAITRGGDGVKAQFERYAVEILQADLSRKHMHPAINTITATHLDAIGGLARHVGEEFLYVLEGSIVLHSELYAPLRLQAGDSIYFDGSVGHAYLSAGSRPARILVVVAVEDLDAVLPQPIPKGRQ